MNVSTLRRAAGAMLGALVWAAPAWAARSGDQGYGLLVGIPSGVSAKYWLNDLSALDGGVGVVGGDWEVHADFLYHDFRWYERLNMAPPSRDAEVPFYFGIGPRLVFADEREFGLRLPAGFSYLPHADIWEVFAEVAPVVRLTPDWGLNGDIAVGARYYFTAIRPRQ